MSKTNLQENTVNEEFDIASVPSLDDFMRELELRESELDISGIKEIEVESPYSRNSKSHKSAKLNEHESSDDIQKLRSQLEKSKKEVIDISTNLTRCQTDFDSFRKRTERERKETFQKVLGRFASKMIPVVDNLNRALDLANVTIDKSSETQRFIDGIVLVNHQIQDTLSEMGIVPIHAIGEVFDPHFHEAVATEERDDVAQNTVIEELLRGYRVGETVIRATMVKVAV